MLSENYTTKSWDIESYDDEDDINHLDTDLDIVFNNEDIQSPEYPENYETYRN